MERFSLPHGSGCDTLPALPQKNPRKRNLCAMSYIKFNIVTELRKTLSGKQSMVSPETLLLIIGPDYLIKASRGNDKKDER